MVGAVEVEHAVILISRIVVLALAIGLRVSAQTALDEFVGKDLWSSHYSHSARLRLEKLVGEVQKADVMPPSPWRVFRFARREETRYIVVMGEQLIIIPGGTSACIQLFDGSAKKIAGWCFLTGWRNMLQDVSAEFSQSLDAYLVVIRTAHMINGPDVAKQYFAIRKDRLCLIRLEDSDGAARQNEYVFPNYEIGIPPDAESVEEWASLLESKDRTDVLSAFEVDPAATRRPRRSQPR